MVVVLYLHILSFFISWLWYSWQVFLLCHQILLPMHNLTWTCNQLIANNKHNARIAWQIIWCGTSLYPHPPPPPLSPPFHHRPTYNLSLYHPASINSRFPLLMIHTWGLVGSCVTESITIPTLIATSTLLLQLLHVTNTRIDPFRYFDVESNVPSAWPSRLFPHSQSTSVQESHLALVIPFHNLTMSQRSEVTDLITWSRVWHLEWRDWGGGWRGDLGLAEWKAVICILAVKGPHMFIRPCNVDN